MKLLEINKAILEVIEEGIARNEETGEVFDLSDLETLNIAFREKVDGIAYFIKNEDAMAKMMNEEAKALYDRAKKHADHADKLKKYLLTALQERDMTKFETVKNKITTRKSTAVNITDQDMLPKKYFIKKVDLKPDKKLIKETIASGKTVKGAELETRVTLSVK